MNRPQPLTKIDPHDAEMLGFVSSSLPSIAVRLSYTFRDEADMERLIGLFGYTPNRSN